MLKVFETLTLYSSEKFSKKSSGQITPTVSGLAFGGLSEPPLSARTQVYLLLNISIPSSVR
jgi:hypothetical protein